MKYKSGKMLTDQREESVEMDGVSSCFMYKMNGMLPQSVGIVGSRREDKGEEIFRRDVCEPLRTMKM